MIVYKNILDDISRVKLRRIVFIADYIKQYAFITNNFTQTH
jgi:hypothetical protein